MAKKQYRKPKVKHLGFGEYANEKLSKVPFLTLQESLDDTRLTDIVKGYVIEELASRKNKINNVSRTNKYRSASGRPLLGGTYAPQVKCVDQYKNRQRPVEKVVFSTKPLVGGLSNKKPVTVTIP